MKHEDKNKSRGTSRPSAEKLGNGSDGFMPPAFSLNKESALPFSSAGPPAQMYPGEDLINGALETGSDVLEGAQNIGAGIANGAQGLGSDIVNGAQGVWDDFTDDIIDSTDEAVQHYYFGGGKAAEIGPESQKIAKNCPDSQYYLERIRSGKTSSPASGSGLGIDLEAYYTTYHMGDTPISYETTCNKETCTTVFTSKGDGFWDILPGMGTPSLGPIPGSGPLIGGDDKAGPDGEWGGTPYAYKPFSWSETFPNPGYEFDKNGTPSPIKEKMEDGEGRPSDDSWYDT